MIEMIWETAQRHFEQSLALARALGYEGQVPFRIMNIGWMYLDAGNWTRRDSTSNEL